MASTTTGLAGVSRIRALGEDLRLTIMEGFPDPVYLLDPRGGIDAANPAGRALLPPGAEEPFTLFPEEVGHFAVSGEDGGTFEKELPFEGGPRHFQVQWSRLAGVGGMPAGILAVLTDISARVRAHRELEARHEEITLLFERMSFAKHELEGAIDCVQDMVVFTDRHHRVRRCNRRFQEFVGKDYRQIIGGDLEEFLREKDISVELAGMQDVVAYQETKGRWFHVRSSPFIRRAESAAPPDPETSAVNIATLHDISDRMRAMEEIGAKNEKLVAAYNELKQTQAHILQQEKMASIGQLAAGVAHEINNPMGFIASNLRTLRKYVDRLVRFIEVQDLALREAGEEKEAVRQGRAAGRIGDIQGDIHSLLEESLEGAERVRQIVLNLKSFSRVDQAEHQHADINECLDSTINIVWNEIKYKATLAKELGEIPRTKCYPQQINQVLMNILVNASHAIAKQGEIRVRSWAEDAFVCVSVSDTGCGIPPEHLDRIFEPFFTTKEVGKGTGLGLSIAYEIVKRHKGELRVESEVGKGSTFTMRIPIVDPA